MKYSSKNVLYMHTRILKGRAKGTDPLALLNRLLLHKFIISSSFDCIQSMAAELMDDDHFVRQSILGC